MALITENNQQYYQGSQGFRGTGNALTITTTFNTDLVFTDANSWNPASENYALNNFKIYTSTTGFPGSWSEYLLQYSVANNAITFAANPANNLYIVVQLKILDGGKYASTLPEEATGDAVENNYGGYQYIKLNDIIDNYMVGYVGDGKIIQNAKKSDVLFFAKRSLQEFSYDTLKSVKSQEITIPPSLGVTIPQDYVNYVSLAYIDQLGVRHPIYPANNLTSSPYEVPLQDEAGDYTMDNTGDLLEGTSITNERWGEANNRLLNGNITFDDYWSYGSYLTGNPFYGQRYGNDPQNSQRNGWFNMNERDGTIAFSSNLKDRLIILDYISDGLAYDLDSRIPKMAEDALYAHILYSILASRINQPEYVIQRLKKDRSAKLRNAKIRLSNIKLSEIVQVMRGKSKWIKS